MKLMLPVQIQRRLKDGDVGPITDGMGAYCPCPLISELDLAITRTEIIKKALNEMKKRGINYCGVLSATVALTAMGPMILHFGCRFRDLEAQVILPLIEAHLYDIIDACCNDRLENIEMKRTKNNSTVGIIMASEGYPEAPIIGRRVISKLSKANQETFIPIFRFLL